MVYPAAPREAPRQTKAPRRWVIGRTIEREVATDSLYDQLATKRSYGVLTIIDPFWRFSPAMESLLTFRGPDVVKSTVGLLKKPGDKCTEFVSPISTRRLMSSVLRATSLDQASPHLNRSI